jgi:hypothetical protein
MKRMHISLGLVALTSIGCSTMPSGSNTIQNTPVEPFSSIKGQGRAVANLDFIEAQIEQQIRELNLRVSERAHHNLQPETKARLLMDLRQANAHFYVPPRPPIPVPPGPGPGPRPPYPPMPPRPPLPPRFAVVAEGKFETTPFRFEAMTVDMMFNQCSDFVRATGPTRADDIYVSFNGRAYITLRNSSSWWSGQDEICNQVYQLATPENIAPEPYTGTLIVEGYIETTKVEFIGNSFGQVYNQCYDMYSNGTTKVDDMEISTNGSRREKLRNGASWWEGPREICDVVTQRLTRP